MQCLQAADVVREAGQAEKLPHLELVSATVAVVSLIIAALLESPGMSTYSINGHSITPALVTLDTLACAFFWWEFWIGIRGVVDKRRYFLSHIINLLGAIPMVGTLRWLRLLRLFRLFRFIRVGVSVVSIWRRWSMDLAREPLQVLATGSLILVVLGSTVFYFCEAGSNAGITSFWDAVWWTVISATTVGYGDLYPVTMGGKITAVVVLVMGIGLIGSLTAALATTIIRGPEQTGLDVSDVLERMDRLEEQQERLIALLESRKQ